MALIKVDVVTEHTTVEQVKADLAAYDVRAIVVREEGPAGGWPEFALEGTEDALRRALTEWYGMDAAEARDLYGL